MFLLYPYQYVQLPPRTDNFSVECSAFMDFIIVIVANDRIYKRVTDCDGLQCLAASWPHETTETVSKYNDGKIAMACPEK
jgi:hypothetical protein